MRHWLTAPDAPIEQDTVKRFDPLHWTVDFPRGAMASVVTSADGHGLTAEASFLRANDLVGLIWSSADDKAHPAHRRETSRDYGGCVLKFRWRSSGLVALNAVNGPTLTIEGRDAGGAPRSWYVIVELCGGHGRRCADHARFRRTRRRVFAPERGGPSLSQGYRPDVLQHGAAGL